MINKQAFRAGFLCGLAEQGLTPEEFEAGLDKKAFLGGVVGRLGASAVSLLPWLAVAGVLGAKTLGRGAGRAAQSLTEPTETDLDIAKKEEELSQYKRLTGEARLRDAERALRVKPI